MTHHQPTMPPDWGVSLATISDAVAQAMEANEAREQACAGWSTQVNWEAWKEAEMRYQKHVDQFPQPGQTMDEIDLAMAESEEALRGLVHAAEQLHGEVQAWMGRAPRIPFST